MQLDVSLGPSLEKSKEIAMQIVLETLLKGNSENITQPFSAAHVLLMRIFILRQLGFEGGHGSQPSKQRPFFTSEVLG